MHTRDAKKHANTSIHKRNVARSLELDPFPPGTFKMPSPEPRQEGTMPIDDGDQSMGSPSPSVELAVPDLTVPDDPTVPAPYAEEEEELLALSELWKGIGCDCTYEISHGYGDIFDDLQEAIGSGERLFKPCLASVNEDIRDEENEGGSDLEDSEDFGIDLPGKSCLFYLFCSLTFYR